MPIYNDGIETLMDHAYLCPTQLYEAYIFDLDGTVYLGEALLPTAAGRRPRPGGSHYP